MRTIAAELTEAEMKGLAACYRAGFQIESYFTAGARYIPEDAEEEK